MMADYPFKNLVFHGGGVRAFAYHGALMVLDEHGILPRIERVSGTSAGAMTAAMVSFRLRAQETVALFRSLDYSKIPEVKEEVERHVNTAERTWRIIGGYRGRRPTMKKVIGLAGSEREAEQAVEKLMDAGFDRTSVSVLRTVDAFWASLGCTPMKIVATDFAIGAALGVACYALFGVLAAVGEVALGSNNQVAMEALAIFGLLGVLVGGLLGFWFGLGELEDEGRATVRGIQRGGKLVMVCTSDEHAAHAQRLLQEADLQAVKICTSDGPMHAELGHAYWAADGLSNRIRWTARGLSVVLALVVLGFFIIEGLAAGEPPNLGLASLVDDFLMLSLLMTLLGIVVAWHWEGIGAVLIAGSVLLFAGINAILQGAWHFNVLVLLSLVVAALFVWDWWRSERTHLDMRSAGHV